MSLLPGTFQFSQSSLQDYVDCPRRFELRYLQQVKYPAAEAEPLAEHERQMQLGDDFHRLVQQHQAGVPESLLTATIQNETILRWWASYLKYGLSDLPLQRYAEATLVTRLNDFRLIAKYDLLAVESGQKLVIVDWKTSPKRPTRERLAKRLQTMVYRYVLVEAGQHLNDGEPVRPEQVSMMYWFAEHPDQPVIFDYDARQHIEAGEYLRGLIGEIEARSVFELTPDTNHCKYCVYRSLNRRGIEAGNWLDEDNVAIEVGGLPDNGFDFDQIAEIEF
jgi:hypothetical protein